MVQPLEAVALQKVVFGNVCHVRSLFVDLGPISMDSKQREVPDDC
jgi:hypothetical protein